MSEVHETALDVGTSEDYIKILIIDDEPEILEES
jgi:hypothetical protein